MGIVKGLVYVGDSNKMGKPNTRRIDNPTEKFVYSLKKDENAKVSWDNIWQRWELHYSNKHGSETVRVGIGLGTYPKERHIKRALRKAKHKIMDRKVRREVILEEANKVKEISEQVFSKELNKDE